ncbi:MAG: hypothetical protein WDZ74_01905 [Candidatus Paceibacterota bacterium]
MKFFNNSHEPEIIIQYASLIDPVATYYVKNHPLTKKFGWHDWTPPDKKEIEQRVESYKEEWKKHTIVRDISKTLNLSFRRNAIDVYVVSGALRATSRPIIISSTEKPKQFVVTLAHELIHQILANNNMPIIAFGENESNRTNSHIIVNAVLKKVLHEELWSIACSAKSKFSSKEYARARELSEKIGADEVIKKYRPT